MAVSVPHALMVRDQECGRYSAPLLLWYVIQAEPGSERLASQSILALGFQRFLPMVRRAIPASGKRPRRTEVIPAFTGYLFALWSEGDCWQRIKAARGVAGILHRLGDPEQPAPVSSRFMAALLAVASPLGVLQDARSDPDILPPLDAGREVVVTQGLFAGQRAICEMSGAERISILLASTQHRLHMRRDHVAAV